MSLGSKISQGYGFFKRALGTGIGIGRKVRELYNSPLATELRSFLPTSFQAPLEIAEKIGGKLLGGAEQLQQKLNTGEQLAGVVRRAGEMALSGELQRAPKSVELARGLMPEASQRVPAVVASGGLRQLQGMESQVMGRGASLPTFPFGFGNVANPVGKSIM